MKNYILDGHKLIYHIDRLNNYLEYGDCYPIYMEISPVGSCNHRCLFCAYDFIGHPNRKLERNRLLSLLDELKGSGIKSLLFSGEGEPLLHPDIEEFITHSHNLGVDVGLFTNGQLLKKELAEVIMPSLTFMRFSFNGGTPDNYAAIHKVKSSVFKRVVSNIADASRVKKEKGLNIDIGVQYVLLPENVNYLISAVKTIKDAGADYFVIKPFVQQSEQQFYKLKHPLKLEDIEAVLDEAEGLSRDDFKVIARRDSFKGYGERCYKRCYGTSFISVLNSAGDLANCLPYWDKKDFVFGNIYEDSFKDIWTGERRKKIKMYLVEEMDAQQCPPNCRPNAVNEFLWEVKNPTVSHLNFI